MPGLNQSRLKTARLTKRVVDAVIPPPKGDPPAEVWDTEIKGFHVRVPPSGRAVYRFWYRARGAQRVVTLGPHGIVTAEQARDRALALAGAVAEGRDPAEEKQAADRAVEEERRRSITVAELIERWLVEGRTAAPNKRARSWATDASCLRRHIVPLLGKVAVQNITKDDIAKAQRDIAAGKTAKDEKTGWRGRAIVRGGGGIARRSLAALSSCLSWAVDQEIIAANPVRRVKLLPQNRSERFLSEAETARLLDTMSAMEREGALLRVHADAVRTLLLTGARRSEIAELSWDEVDLERGLLALPPNRHKAGASQGPKHIVLNSAAAALVASRPRIGPKVFPAPTDPQQGCDASLSKAWGRVRKNAQLNGLRLHDLRHSFASFGAASGASLLLIGKALGHTQVTTTQRYSHLGNEPLRDLANKIGDKITAAQGRGDGSEGNSVVSLSTRSSKRRGKLGPRAARLRIIPAS